MKPIAIFLGLSLSLLLTACGDGGSSGGNSGNGGNATTPIDSCISSGTCNNTLYNNYSQYGWTAYPSNPSGYGYGYGHAYGYYQYYGNSSYYNYCSCPSGSQAVYNPNIGLGCLQNNYYQAYSPYMTYFTYNSGSYGPANNHWVNIPRVSNTQGYYDNSCLNNVAQSCYVGAANTCPSNSQCIPTAAGSRLGLCIRN